MDPEIYTAAVEGNSSILEADDTSELLKTVPEIKNNIIHVAVRNGREDFIKKAASRFPELISKTNSCSETPCHFAAETGDISILEVLLEEWRNSSSKCPECISIANSNTNPWRVQDLKGNTPIHVAIIHGKLEFAVRLLREDPGLAGIVNHSGEAPLHLAVTHRVDDEQELYIRAVNKAISKVGANFVYERPPQLQQIPDIIQMLLEENRDVACWRDSNGLTPLLRATLLKKSYVEAIKSILDHCPQSLELFDPSNKNILHLLCELPDLKECDYLLCYPHIQGIKNLQDSAGNTPAHIAIKKHNALMLRLLFRLPACFDIKNVEGFSATYLLELKTVVFHNHVIEEKDPIFPCKHIEGELDELEVLSRDLHRSNIIHEPWRKANYVPGDGNVLHFLSKKLKSISGESLWRNDNFQQFINNVVERYPFRISETDNNGDSPLHHIAIQHPEAIDGSLLDMFDRYYQMFGSEAMYMYSPPWKMKNYRYNTPLHEALIGNKASVRCVVGFLKLDPELARFRNRNKDTPLHLLSQVSLCFESIRDFEGIDGWEPSSGSVRDKCKLTPLLKAAQENNLPLVKLLYTVCPPSASKAKKDTGQIFWHLLASQPSFESDYENVGLNQFLASFDNCQLDAFTGKLLFEVDNDRKTPLHVALEKKNFRFAQFLIELCQRAQEELKEQINLSNILTMPDKEGIRPVDLIGNADHVPREFDNFLWRNQKLVKDMLGVRSLSGLSTLMIKDYIGTIGVVAALLATISFNAAMNVPGGWKVDNGAPLFLKNKAFQLFMISDILAMCLSMMVLTFLLWIMTMGKKKESIVLLDVTIFLLRLSFYATLLAFMARLYLTAFHLASWIVIFGFALCLSVILLLHKRLIAVGIPGFIKISLLYQQIANLLGDFLYLLFCGVPRRATRCCVKLKQNNQSIGPSSTIRYVRADPSSIQTV